MEWTGWLQLLFWVLGMMLLSAVPSRWEDTCGIDGRSLSAYARTVVSLSTPTYDRTKPLAFLIDRIFLLCVFRSILLFLLNHDSLATLM